MRSGSRLFPALLAVASMLVPFLVVATPLQAVEVRQPEDGASFQAALDRSYAPCTTPNRVAWDGAPACSTVVTSDCPFGASFTAAPPGFAADPIVPEAALRLSIDGNSAICRTRAHAFALGIRTTTDLISVDDPENEDTPACPSRHCTFPDLAITESSQFQFLSIFFDAHGERDPSYEILDLSVAGPDGLPLAGLSLHPGGPALTTNLTLPYPPCTAPGPGGACDLVPPTTFCDFESGAITWQGLTPLGASYARVVMSDLAGASPLCTSEPYTLEATLRATGRVCGTTTQPERCTVADRTVSVPLPVKGRRIDALAKMPLDGLGDYYESRLDNIEIVAARILDPMGEPVAVHGISGVRSLVGSRVAIKGDRVRVQATIPVNQNAPMIDPTLEGGATVTLSDRDGAFYTVTIPPVRWQDQTPLGSRWTYADPGGVLGGVRKAYVKRLGKPETLKGYKLDLRAEGVDLSGLDVPSLTLSIAIARPDILGGDPQIHRASRHCTGVFKGPKLDCK